MPSKYLPVVSVRDRQTKAFAEIRQSADGLIGPNLHGLVRPLGGPTLRHGYKEQRVVVGCMSQLLWRNDPLSHFGEEVAAQFVG